MGLGYLVCHYCPAGNSVWTIERDDHQAAAATYEEHVRRWPDTPISLSASSFGNAPASAVLAIHPARSSPARSLIATSPLLAGRHIGAEARA